MPADHGPYVMPVQAFPIGLSRTPDRVTGWKVDIVAV
jgi:hypothetical protein